MTLAGAHVKKDGFVRIQRRWIENTLPDCELLEAVAYRHLAELLSDVHRAMGLKETEITDISIGEIYDPKSMHGRLPMHGGSCEMANATASSSCFAGSLQPVASGVRVLERSTSLLDTK